MNFYFESGQSQELIGVILAGGTGSRLRPLTNETSKQLLPIGGQPMIQRSAAQIREAGIRKLIVVTDHNYAHKYMDVLKDGHDLGFDGVSYIWQSPEGKGLPTAIAQAQEFIKPHRMLVACGDVLIEQGYGHAVNHFSYQQIGARMIGMSVDDVVGYSALKTRGEQVLAVKPKDKINHISGVIDLGVYMYPSNVFDKISKLKPSDRGETEINDLNNLYAQENSLWHSRVWGWWSDCGSSIEEYKEANARYEKN